jgi:hypothetical protein
MCVDERLRATLVRAHRKTRRLEFQNRRAAKDSQVVMLRPYIKPSTIAPTKARARYAATMLSLLTNVTASSLIYVAARCNA